VTETVVTTLGPNGMWNAAALGVEAEGAAGDSSRANTNGAAGVHTPDGYEGTASARTWGRTRTRRNFERERAGYVCFVHDPVVFARAAMTVVEHDDPVPEAALAWAEVEVERTDAGERGGTEWADWELSPVESAVVEEAVPLINRGHAAVVEATVAASRLGVPEYDDAELRDRLDYFADVIERAGSEREREALAVVAANSAWRR
jgi:hypothetical protein